MKMQDSDAQREDTSWGQADGCTVGAGEGWRQGPVGTQSPIGTISEVFHKKRLGEIRSPFLQYLGITNKLYRF